MLLHWRLGFDAWRLLQCPNLEREYHIPEAFLETRTRPDSGANHADQSITQRRTSRLVATTSIIAECYVRLRDVSAVQLSRNADGLIAPATVDLPGCICKGCRGKCHSKRPLRSGLFAQLTVAAWFEFVSIVLHNLSLAEVIANRRINQGQAQNRFPSVSIDQPFSCTPHNDIILG